ncbi:thioesterase II family protein [Mucilaginibacter sp. P25]|uniref:thioesterase II family protein n=1 Tax=Mucilaginibacter sp. P25 TaxID=3423945 RepID=UPI003D7A8CF7
MQNYNLICLPFAGGNRYSYRNFSNSSSPGINLITLEYPGRGMRLDEPLIVDINLLVEDLFVQLTNISHANKYVIYGHSMGGLLAYLLAKKILNSKLCPPVHLFISGTSGPSSPKRRQKNKHLLGKREFIEEIVKLNVDSKEVLENQELLELLEPILRADFQASETFEYHPTAPIDIPITIITGTEEELEPEEIYAWKQETSYPITFKKISGGHFFITNHPKKMIEIFSKIILYK